MKTAMTFAMTLALALSLSLGAAVAQLEAPVDETEAGETPEEEVLHFSDYMVKGYSLTGYYGNFSGGTYLDNQALDERTVLTQGAGDIRAYDGTVLIQSLDPLHYDAARKEIEAGPAFGGRIGIFVNRDFHLDLIGTYATGKAVTSMIYKPDPDDSSLDHRIVVDEDNGYSLIKGGVHLAYDAHPASFWGITPRLGFGLGGLINSYTTLEDKTALYLEGNLGLFVEIFDDVSLVGQVDLTTFAYEVDELDYSNIVKYTTFSLGLTWFIDVIPDDVRASHLAELEAAENY